MDSSGLTLVMRYVLTVLLCGFSSRKMFLQLCAVKANPADKSRLLPLCTSVRFNVFLIDSGASPCCQNKQGTNASLQMTVFKNEGLSKQAIPAGKIIDYVADYLILCLARTPLGIVYYRTAGPEAAALCEGS